MNREIPVIFGEQQQLGIIHIAQGSQTGVVIVVGGPQYRIGSHRQFLKLSRFLATSGITSIRFDCAGMGDSGGEFKSYMDIDTSIKQAIDTLQLKCPEIKKIVLWGLCDAATAITKYCETDSRITGLFLLNPWVKNEQLAAESLVKNHYKKQMFSLQFWKRVFTGQVKIFSAASDFVSNLLVMKKNKNEQIPKDQPQHSQPGYLQEMMLQKLQRFEGKTQIVLSENDLTAKEFVTATNGQKWQQLISTKPIPITTIAGANHTFASEQWRSQVQDLTLEFVSS